MKKFIVLSLAGLLILAFGATAYAQAPKLEFRASGFIDMQTFMGRNVPQYMNTPQAVASSWFSTGFGTAVGPPVFYGTVNPAFATTAGGGAGAGIGGPGWNKKDSHWEARASLKFDAIMGPNLSGTIMFEIDTMRWGSTWAGYPGMGREANNFGAWTTDRTAVEVKNIYIDVGLPYFGIPVPITVRVGAQPIGVRPQILMTSDGMGVTAGIKIDPVLIAPIYAKPLEGNDFREDDCDVYGLHVNAKLGTLTVGGYGLFWRMNTYPFWTLTTTGLAGFPAALNPILVGTNDAEMWWLGAYLDGKAGPVNINLDFVFDFGKVQEKLSTVRDVSYQGWAARAKVEFPWEKFSFGAVGMYATGPDTRATSPEGRPGQLTNFGTLARRNSGYVVPPGSEQGPANSESLVVYSMEGGATGGYGLAERANYAGLSPGGFGGTWFAKLFASAKIAPWYKLTLQGLYIGDTTHNGNSLGTAFKRPGTGSLLLRDDRRIGWEFNMINEFWIYQNLRWFVGAGYLFAGDALDVGRFDAGGHTFNRHIENPWAIRTRLMYTF
jgi:hypothetical protein